MFVDREIPIDDIVVTIGHPHGDIDVPLAQWIAVGPGPRDMVRPVAARRASTGERLPLDAIPLQFRNNETSRAMIARGLLVDPWPGA
jgi:hypothetical protein